MNGRLLGTYQWALVPSAPNPAEPFILTVTKADSQADRLAERVSKRLGNDGALNTQQAGATIRLQLNRIPALWAKGHVRVGDLWTVYAQYAYMPRLKDQAVLNAGLQDQPLLWQHDGFALAEDYDEGTARYQGLILPPDGITAAVTDSWLLVKPEAAQAQRTAELNDAKSSESDDDIVVPPSTPGPTTTPVDEPPRMTRFFGIKELSSERYALDFKKIVDEVLAQLSAAPGTRLTVRVEIEATSPEGFDEAKIRTVAENANTLKFDDSGFEES